MMSQRNPDQVLQEAITHISALREVYVRENKALSSSDTAGFLALQEEKLAAARNYQHSVSGILKEREAYGSFNPVLKNRLQAMQTDFSGLMKTNMDMLERMRRCTERLGEMIMSAARDAAQRERAVNYGECGNLQGEDRKSVSMGLNETA